MLSLDFRFKRNVAVEVSAPLIWDHLKVNPRFTRFTRGHDALRDHLLAAPAADPRPEE